ncbi:UDP-glucosyl transferase 73C2 [Actinidia rufa]|uniref:UDP-glucosyl transferase 73C2 n=1 Tax=Actinidia rufa TaxID=165716 RepID=A0A7J0FUP0_9ERIC|nr:UDP-glucosyl transferase 73C2 [Actinidia rufa]
MVSLNNDHRHHLHVVLLPLMSPASARTIHRTAAAGLPLRLLSVPFPATEVGLPEGCESVETVPSIDLLKNFLLGMELLQQPFEQLLGQLGTVPKLHNSRQKVSHGLPKLPENSRAHESVSESETFVLPGLPDTIEMTRSQLPPAFNPGTFDAQDFRKRVKGKRVWCIGPLSLCNKDNLDKAQRGYKASVDEKQCFEVVLEIGVSVGAQGVVHLLEDDKFGVVVKSEAVVEAVETVMDGGEKGVERRNRAIELGKMAKRAMEEGGSFFLECEIVDSRCVMQQI